MWCLLFWLKESQTRAKAHLTSLRNLRLKDLILVRSEVPSSTHPSLPYCHSPPLPHRHPQRPEGPSPLHPLPISPFLDVSLVVGPSPSPLMPRSHTGWGGGLGFLTDRFSSAHPSQKWPGGASVKKEKIPGINCRQRSARAFEQGARGASHGDLADVTSFSTPTPTRSTASSSPGLGPGCSVPMAQDRCCQEMHLPPSAAQNPVTALQHLQSGDRSSPPPRRNQRQRDAEDPAASNPLRAPFSGCHLPKMPLLAPGQ